MNHFFLLKGSNLTCLVFKLLMYVKKAFLQFSVVLCIVAFILPRIASLHAFSHTEEKQSIPITCDLMNTTDTATPFLKGSLSYALVHFINPSRILTYSGYDIPLFKIASPGFIYNKPPPLY